MDLAEKSFTPTHVRNKPLIFVGRAVQRTKAKLSSPTLPPIKQKSEATEHKGDLLICDLCENGTDSVHDMRVVNTDAKYHLANTLEKCLQEA